MKKYLVSRDPHTSCHTLSLSIELANLAEIRSHVLILKKEPYTHTKELYRPKEEPFKYTKEPYIHTNEPCKHIKELYTHTNKPDKFTQK